MFKFSRESLRPCKDSSGQLSPHLVCTLELEGVVALRWDGAWRVGWVPGSLSVPTLASLQVPWPLWF